MQPGDEVRDLGQLNGPPQLRQRSFARDRLQQQRARRRVMAPHQRYPSRRLPALKRRGLRGPKLRLGRELENSAATVGVSAPDHEGRIAAPNSFTDDQFPALRKLSEEAGEPFPPGLDSRSKSHEETITSRGKRRRGETHATTVPGAPPSSVPR